MISAILKKLNASSARDNFVLKGGTSLLFCYGLNRFSEDIDLDAVKKVRLEKLIEQACIETRFPYKISVKKDSDTVLRYMIEFQEELEIYRYPLKVEISFRNSMPLSLGALNPVITKGIRTYSMDVLASMKVAAFRNRHAIRDFYDICWIVTTRPEVITPSMAIQIWEQIQYRDLNILIEELKEVSMDDHIMKEVDIESLALQMIDILPDLIRGGSTRSNSFVD